MNSIYLAKLTLTKIGHKAVIKAGLAKTQVIGSATHHASLIKVMNNKIISGALTYDKQIEKYKIDYEKIGYKGQLGSEKLAEMDYVGEKVEQHVSYPGIEGHQQYADLIRTNNLDEFFIKHSKECIMFVDKQMQLVQEGKLGLIKIAAEHAELINEGIKGIGN